MKKNPLTLFCLILFISFSVNAQKKTLNKKYFTTNIGVGVRLGNITGVSVKKYLANDRALELSVGRFYYWGGGYDNFYTNKRFKDKSNYVYAGWGNSFALQLHYLVHKDLSSILDNLKWYYGAGGQLRATSYHYYHLDAHSPLGANGIYVDLGVGVDGVAGLEYTFDKIPLSIFLDANLYMELFNNPFLFNVQSGTGVRYNF